MKAAKALVKMGRFEAARNCVKNAAKSGIEWRDDEKKDFQLCLDFIDKKEKSGYVYKPRPRKNK